MVLQLEQGHMHSGAPKYGFQNLEGTSVYGGNNLPPLVGIGLRWLPKLDVDTSPRPHAHRRACENVNSMQISPYSSKGIPGGFICTSPSWLSVTSSSSQYC